MSQTFIICKEIRQVQGGFIVEVRWPFGPDVSGYGEVICRTFSEVIDLLRKATIFEKGSTEEVPR